MENIIDELVAQGFEVSGGDSGIKVKISAITGKATIRKNAYSNRFVVSSHSWVQLAGLSLTFFSILLSLFSFWGQSTPSGTLLYIVSIGIPLVFSGFVSVIIAEIQLQPVRQIVRMANMRLSDHLQNNS
tara:strand:- start:665 stop:1051 length:387 start_codon:yes stop_codon:yes gene_type:complete